MQVTREMSKGGERMEKVIVTRRTFLIGLVIAILAASLISTVISTQLAVGPQGLKGDKGDAGSQGLQGLPGIYGVNGTDGLDGKSAYEIWLDQGNSGTEQDFLDSLKGERGPPVNFSIANMSGWLPSPAYDSGWLNNWVAGVDYQLISLTYELNTTEVFVYVLGRVNETIGEFENGSIHQFAYGGLLGPLGGNAGVFWVLSGNEIKLYRLPNDEYWHEVRVMIWKIPQP
jgi:hypothetical protein